MKKVKHKRDKHDCDAYRKHFNNTYDVCRLCGKFLHKSKRLDLNSSFNN